MPSRKISSDNQHAKIYTAICLTLSNRANQVNWASFTLEDWDLLPRIAQAEGVAPLIYWIVRGSEGLRSEFDMRAFAILMHSYYATAARNQLLFRELDLILKAVNGSDIPVIVLKGAALAVTIYPDIALRPMGDLDLLVAVENLAASFTILCSLGYRQQVLTVSHLPMLGGPQNNIVVELHWDLFGDEMRNDIKPIEWFWGHVKSDEMHSGRFYLPLLENLLYLCLHLSSHYENEGVQPHLLWFYDIHLHIHKFSRNIQWDELAIQAQRFGWLPQLTAVLKGVQDRFGTEFPKGFLNILGESLRSTIVVPGTKRIMDRQTRTERLWGVLLAVPWSIRFQVSSQKVGENAG